MSDTSFGGMLRTPPGTRLKATNKTEDVWRSVWFQCSPSYVGRWIWFLDGEMLSSVEYTFKGQTLTLDRVAVYPGQTVEGVYLGHDENYLIPPARINRITVQKETVAVAKGQTLIALTKDIPIDARRVDVFVGGLYQSLNAYTIKGSKSIELGSAPPVACEALVVAYMTPFDQDPNAF